MSIIITSRSFSKLGHVGSDTRSLGQILEKPCVHSRGHRFDHKFMKLGYVGSKTRSQGQILEKSCGPSRGHNLDSKFMKLYQNVNPHNI